MKKFIIPLLLMFAIVSIPTSVTFAQDDGNLATVSKITNHYAVDAAPVLFSIQITSGCKTCVAPAASFLTENFTSIKTKSVVNGYATECKSCKIAYVSDADLSKRIGEVNLCSTTNQRTIFRDDPILLNTGNWQRPIYNLRC